MTGTASVLRFLLRRDRWWFLWWPLGVGVLYVSQGWSVDRLYTTQAEFDRAATTMAANPALIAMTGPARALNTTGGQVFWQAAAYGAICVGLMSMFLVGRHTRAEEEIGRDELVRAAPVTRLAPTYAAVAVAVLANLVVGVVTAAMLIGYGLSAPDSLAAGVGLMVLGWLFTGTSLVAAQLTASTRGMYGIAGAGLALAYLLRAVGDVSGGPWSWLSPIGWYQAMHPFSGLRWWPVLLLLAGTVVTVGVAALLHGRRDYASGLLPPRPGAARAALWLSTPVGLQWRLLRGSVWAWSSGLLLLGLAFGSIGNSASELMGGGEFGAEILVPGADVTASFYATMLLLIGLLAAAFAIGSALHAKSDEDTGRIEMLLATGLSRTRYLAGGVVITVLGSLLALMAGAVGLIVAYALVTSDTSRTGDFLLGGVQLIAPVLVLSALTRLLYGLRAPLGLLGWAALTFCTVAMFLGPALQLPDWLLDLSPFTHIAAVPADAFDPVSFVALLLLAAALGLGALTAYRHRELHG